LTDELSEKLWLGKSLSHPMKWGETISVFKSIAFTELQ
jgi:hypothetical protein